MTRQLTMTFAFLFTSLCMLFSSGVANADDTKKIITESSAQVKDAQATNGQVKLIAGQERAWQASQAQWLSLDAFWQYWADSRGGITWGSSRDYPPYDQVKEQDTLLIQLDSGTCMMEFWHSRWRRANDVRRWDDAFNHYSACPYVFD
ncbi:hypothetical protein [Shewanella woodyi]|uniref:Uncharacterized protein n=1 Tax=Shewanella woodyi (strain ATCC 51908 / MS32) TaxID=392500 RepID=B1KDI9_SHEWM|nr:hypothetical protein [Shewanella woodyi]ACA84990.1 hypothetical protein Swoo_0695 [Shewanella woodyi ATCC 51908]